MSPALPSEPVQVFACRSARSHPQACEEFLLMKMYVHTHMVSAAPHLLVSFSTKCHPIGVCLFTSCVHVVQPAEKDRGWRGASGF